ncbi:SMI1/KNR4 family protein [Streptomyces sp. NPDC046853]|uniref:SMI1/KNR4 family protein n=1 Tax=Streptomyces sp. NPDC046853 TaxID=3154920 RepID=UPI0033D70831
METEEFEACLQASRAQRAGVSHPEGFELFDSLKASDADIDRVERALGAKFPEKYKYFMKEHGGGGFVFLDVLPVVDPDGSSEDVLEVNGGESATQDFIAVAPVGTGDWWGFAVSEGVCLDQVEFLDHENGSRKAAASDFFEFLVREGLRAG